MCEIKMYDPSRLDERKLTNEEISNCIMKIQEILLDAVVIKSIEECGIPTTNHFLVLDVAENLVADNTFSSNAEKTGKFISNLQVSDKDIVYIEKKTWGQSSDDAWKKL